KRIHPKSSLVTWLITLGLIICPSSYKARPDNLIGLYLLTDFCEEIISPQRSDTRPNFPTKSFVGVAKFVWHPGYIQSADLQQGQLPYLARVANVKLSVWMCPVNWIEFNGFFPWPKLHLSTKFHENRAGRF